MLTAPDLLAEEHNLADFACGRPELDAWLRDRAKDNQPSGNTRTRVVVDTEAKPERVVAFYSLAPACVAREQLVRKLKTNAPARVSMILLARLAVDRAYVRRGIGAHLLLDAFRQSVAGAHYVGGRGIMTYAKDDDAAAFYLKWKFQQMPGDERLLVIPMEVVRSSLAEALSAAA